MSRQCWPAARQGPQGAVADNERGPGSAVPSRLLELSGEPGTEQAEPGSLGEQVWVPGRSSTLQLDKGGLLRLGCRA